MPQVITITVQAKDDLNETMEGNFTVTLLDVYEDTDGDGFRDGLEASTGSNINDPTSTPFNHGLVAWYPFDGNASDMSGNGNHGTVNGATLGADRHGSAGKAYSFDGVDDWIDFNGKFRPFKPLFWLKPQGYSIWSLDFRLSHPFENRYIFNNYPGGGKLNTFRDAQNPYNLFVRDGSGVIRQIGFGVEGIQVHVESHFS